MRVGGGTTPPDNEEDTDCSDKIDNDGDGKTDYPDDKGCSSNTDTSEVGGNDDDDDNTVTICHEPGTPAEKTMKVPEAAVDGHLGHGDTLGPCDDDGDDD